jgi:phosphohistidine phosphatase
MRREAKGMSAIGIAPDLIISSTLVRAVQTAEIVQQGLSAPPQMITTHALVPEAHPSQILQELAASHSSLSSVMVVGHEPHMSSLVSYILTGEISWLIDLKKGALCSIDLSPSGRGQLLWALAPRQLRALA